MRGCARATSGQLAAAPPTSWMNSRRFMLAPITWMGIVAVQTRILKGLAYVR
jgi:hypothetical protein